MGQQGRLVIPVEVRAALGLAAGDHLLLHLADGRLVLERPQDCVAQLRARGSADPHSRSMAEARLG